jgi:hypothetical protein
MWGIGIYLMRLADYLKGRKDRSGSVRVGRSTCNRCSQNFENEEELEKHTKKEHSNRFKG